MKHSAIALFAFLLVISAAVGAAGPAYAPAKVVYDVSSGDSAALHAILDRVNLLQNLYDNDPFEASIIVVLHEDAIPRFSNTETGDPELLQRSGSMVMGEIIQLRLCRASARQQGLDDPDFPDFIRIVPMADAEIVQLQHRGYAYLR